ncbi:hypothetical protein TWF225_009576 [Orbilia oligospora]|nr:hypothetical protein TWF225_009576 [Orbilia oligospora]KAF3249824.1 hypothetical protein TWF217_008732 [Orbilia oligospora]KAF3292526.1 hypothetical protein TWF132_005578 [Orbilia oligospora]
MLKCIRGYTPRHTRPTALQSTSNSYVYVHTRGFASESELDLLSSAETPSVAATIVAELQKANVRCTGAGIDTLEEIYAEKTHEEVLGCSQSYELWWTLAANEVSGSDSLSHLDLNISKVRQWRSELALDLWIHHKVYKLWEALYKHSTVFKDMIDEQEKDYVDFNRPGIDSQYLWVWMYRIFREGIVERGDVENLPEVILRDIIIGSGESRLLCQQTG